MKAAARNHMKKYGFLLPPYKAGSFKDFLVRLNILLAELIFRWFEAVPGGPGEGQGKSFLRDPIGSIGNEAFEGL